MNIRYHTFKNKKDMKLILFCHPLLMMIFADAENYLLERYPYLFPIVITQTIAEPLDVSVSQTHKEGRAIDFRTKTWEQIEIDDLEQYINNKYAKDFGTSETGKNVIVALPHDVGKGQHFHFQIRRF